MAIDRWLVRGGTAAALASVNETPLVREMEMETDTRKWKLGDGVTPYNSLDYFDAEAVREGALTEVWPGIGPKHGETDNHKSDYNPMAVNAGRNIRTVWTIATQPYPGAHFATFPRKLVEPCIKAGCPTGGVVLDPFAGSGTTGLVAQSLSRRAVLIDLNGEYLEQVMDRNRDMPLGLGA